MRKQIIIDLESEWVLKRLGDSVPPITYIKEAFEDADGVEVGRGSSTTLYLFVDDEEVNIPALINT